MSSRRINVNIIRIFEGPRHAKLEAIWRWYAAKHADQMTLHVFDNTKLRLPHDEAYQAMWVLEKARTEQYTIFTEFDFLPGKDFLKVFPVHVLAAEYCTRDPSNFELQQRGIPGAWYVAINKQSQRDMPNFGNAGPFNDPCNELDADVVETDDCYPRHYGVKVLYDAISRYQSPLGLNSLMDLGEHLFWSRHYNDDPHLILGGFLLAPILQGVDRAIEEFIS